MYKYSYFYDKKMGMTNETPILCMNYLKA